MLVTHAYVFVLCVGVDILFSFIIQLYFFTFHIKQWDVKKWRKMKKKPLIILNSQAILIWSWLHGNILLFEVSSPALTFANQEFSLFFLLVTSSYCCFFTSSHVWFYFFFFSNPSRILRLYSINTPKYKKKLAIQPDLRRSKERLIIFFLYFRSQMKRGKQFYNWRHGWLRGLLFWNW